jgi:hypothetical protein
VISKIAEPVDVTRWRSKMDVKEFEKKQDAWNTGFSKDHAYE